MYVNQTEFLLCQENDDLLYSLMITLEFVGFIEKSEVESVFQNFYTMVLTQFQEKIKIIRSDNGKEYFNKILGNFF